MNNVVIQVNRKVTQPYIYKYPFFLKLPTLKATFTAG